MPIESVKNIFNFAFARTVHNVYAPFKNATRVPDDTTTWNGLRSPKNQSRIGQFISITRV